MIPERYSRQMLVPGIGEEGQDRISHSCVVIIGLGALGSNIANILARAGVGLIRLVDRDVVDWSNLQRQGLYDEDDARDTLPKAVAARQHLMRINSDITIEAVVDEVHSGNVEELLAGATVVLDGLDNFPTRALINEACVKNGIPWVYGACVSTFGSYASFLPGRTACFNCAFPGVASRPNSPFTCDTAGILGPVAFLIASWEASEAIKIMIGRQGSVSSSLTYLDVWQNSVDAVPLERNSECSVCGAHKFPLLAEERRFITASLCGRNAVQIVPPGDFRLDFDALKEHISKAFPTEENRYLLKFCCGQYEMALFRDGRAIVFGTADVRTAKSLYGRYVGS